MKKVTISTKPMAGGGAVPSADAWVATREHNNEPMKRLTIDVPLSLHQRVKSQCALRGLKMADVMRELLEKHFAEEYQGTRGGGDPLTN
jgi:hypothetical protein